MAKFRMAADVLKKLGGKSKDLLFGNMTKGEIAGRLAPDLLLFGPLAAAQTPGDIGDKAIAYALSAGPSGLTGLGASRVTGMLTKNQTAQGLADMAGSFAGDYAGMYGADALMRLKNKVSGGPGVTPYEQMGLEQQQQMAQQMQQDMLAQYGLIPGTREQYAMDPTTGMGVA